MTKRAMILLADGTKLYGEGFGAAGTTAAEFVFHTGLTGYQEILTDPSYCGQAVVMTYPEIGNTGVNDEDMESDRAWLNGFVVREVSPVPSNWRASGTLDQFLAEHGVVGIHGVDTRALTLKLRDEGAMMGVITTELDEAAAAAYLAEVTPIERQDLVAKVTTPEPYTWREGTWVPGKGHQRGGELPYRVVAYDFGIKRNILRLLVDAGCVVEVVPATTPAEDVLAREPDGVFLSNGPGDPRARPDLAEQIAPLRGRVPLFGICYGFQVLGAAIGAGIDKLVFGHHAANHPVRHGDAGVWITSQNHNYIVDADTLPSDFTAGDINLNDRTLEAFHSREHRVLAIQYHPEASPGPWDARPVFAQFTAMFDGA